MRAAARRRAGTGLLVTSLGVLGLAAGCSSGSSTATTTTTTRPTTTTTTGPTTTTSRPTTTTTTTATTAMCQSSQLSVSPQQGSGAAGTIEMTVVFTNRGASTCSLFGYPGMQLLDASGGNLPTNVVRGGGPIFPVAAANQPPKTVLIASGASASFGLSYSDVPVGNETSCPTSANAEITPPGNTSSVTVALAIAPCGGGTVHVSPVYAG
jgi:Protein of unknown function (DUF4232)